MNKIKKLIILLSLFTIGCSSGPDNEPERYWYEDHKDYYLVQYVSSVWTFTYRLMGDQITEKYDMTSGYEEGDNGELFVYGYSIMDLNPAVGGYDYSLDQYVIYSEITIDSGTVNRLYVFDDFGFGFVYITFKELNYTIAAVRIAVSRGE